MSLVVTGPITPEHVRWAYRLFLDREPESEAVLSRPASSTAELREGFMRSAEYGARSMPALPDKWVLAESAGFQVWVNLSDRAIAWPVLLDCYEPDETRMVRSLLKPGDRAIDIGGNIGYFTLLMASCVGAAGRVLSFEAMPSLRQRLIQSVGSNGWSARIDVAECGLSDRDENLWLIYATVTANSGGAYISPVDTPPEGHSSEPVSVKPLDQVADLDGWRFIKMDVEGAEPRVIRGASELLKRSRPTILCELHNPQLSRVSETNATTFIGEMREAGYRCVSLSEREPLTSFDGPDPINVLFLPS